MPRPLDEAVTRRVLDATVELLVERGYGVLSFDAVAVRAGTGRPALYRRFNNKAELCVAAIDSLLPPAIPDVGGTHEERLRAVFLALAGSDLERYVGLVGELMGVAPHEPTLVAAWRRSVLEPRRQAGLKMFREAVEAGVLRQDVDAEFLLDSVTGQLLAAVWRGRPLDDAWRQQTWQELWAIMSA